MGQALTGPSPTHRLLSSPESRLSLVSGHGFSIEKKRREKKTVRLQLNNSSLGSMAASGEQRGAFSDRPSRSIFGIRHRGTSPTADHLRYWHNFFCPKLAPLLRLELEATGVGWDMAESRLPFPSNCLFLQHSKEISEQPELLFPFR